MNDDISACKSIYVMAAFFQFVRYFMSVSSSLASVYFIGNLAKLLYKAHAERPGESRIVSSIPPKHNACLENFQVNFSPEIQLC